MPPIAPAPQTRMRAVAHCPRQGPRAARASPRRRPSRSPACPRPAAGRAAEIAVAEIRRAPRRDRAARTRSRSTIGLRCARHGRRRAAASTGSSPSTRRGEATGSISCTLAQVLRRVPPVVEEHRHARGGRPSTRGERLRRRVAAVAVDEQDAAEAAVRHAVEHVADDAQVGRDAQRDRARERAEVGRDAVGDDREHRHAERLGGLGRHALGKDAVDREAQMACCSRAAERQHAAVVAAAGTPRPASSSCR